MEPLLIAGCIVLSFGLVDLATGGPRNGRRTWHWRKGEGLKRTVVTGRTEREFRNRRLMGASTALIGIV